jgi:integral membrane sensor domain MASE1
MKTFIFLLFLILIMVAMKMGDIFGIILAMAGFLFMWALMDDDNDNA